MSLSALGKYQQLLVTFGNTKNQQQKIIKLFRKKRKGKFLIYLSDRLQRFGIFLLCATKVS